MDRRFLPRTAKIKIIQYCQKAKSMTTSNKLLMQKL